jgi:hypothetical protein
VRASGAQVSPITIMGTVLWRIRVSLYSSSMNGALMTSKCWNDFEVPFSLTGYTVHTLEWPFLEGRAEALRRNPPSSLGGLSVKAIVAHHASFIRSLEQPPLIVGHSFGGLFVQMPSTKASIGRELRSTQLQFGGIVPGPLTTKSALPVIARVRGWQRPYTLTKRGAPLDARALPYSVRIHGCSPGAR